MDDYNVTDLYKEVASIIYDEIEDYEKAEDWFNDLLSHGCISGMVCALIYYKDTHAFTKKYLDDILELQQDMNSQGLEVHIPNDTDAQNWLAWFAFEETSRQIAIDLGMEV